MSKKGVATFLLSMVLVGLSCGELGAAKASADPEAAQRGVLAKYAAVFRLIPNRVSQMLQVVSAYPSEGQSRRADLLQLVIHRIHEKYRVVQQLQNRVLEVQTSSDARNTLGVYRTCASLIEAIKKYQVTLISILSVLDAEFVRSVRAAGGRSHDQGDEDAAFVAAKKALSPNHIDTIIDSLSLGQPTEEALYGGSVKSELRQLRNEVSLLSAQLQAQALLEKGSTVGEKDFGDQVATLNVQNTEALSQVKQAVGSLGDDAAALVQQGHKKHSYRHSSRMSQMVETVQDRARAFHASLIENGRAVWAWLVRHVVALYDGACALFGRVFSDSQKAVEHVGTRLQEVKEATPEGVAFFRETFHSFAAWLVNSWLRVAEVAVEAVRPLGGYWICLQEKAAAFDQSMRTAACGAVAAGQRGAARVAAIAGECSALILNNFGPVPASDQLAQDQASVSRLTPFKQRFFEAKDAFISCVSLYTEKAKAQCVALYEKARAAFVVVVKAENI